MAEFCASFIGTGVAGGPDTTGLGENATGAGVTIGAPAGVGVLEDGTWGGTAAASTFAEGEVGTDGGGTSRPGDGETPGGGADEDTAALGS